MRHLLSVLAMAALSASPAPAREHPHDGATRPMFSIAVLGGGLSPTREPNDGARFRTGGSLGGALAVWPDHDIGLCATVLRGRTRVDAPSGTRFLGQEPTVWLFGADLRLPIASARSWGRYPCLFGGMGLKHYAFDFEQAYDRRQNDWGGNVGGGLEYRFGRVGLIAEARTFLSKFQRARYRDTQRAT